MHSEEVSQVAALTASPGSRRLVSVSCAPVWGLARTLVLLPCTSVAPCWIRVRVEFKGAFQTKVKEAADGILVGFYPVLQEPQTNIPNRKSVFRPGAGRLPVSRWVFANCHRRFQHVKQQMRKKKKRPVSQRRKSQRANPGRPQRTRRDSNGKMFEWGRESVSVRLLLAEVRPQNAARTLNLPGSCGLSDELRSHWLRGHPVFQSPR